MCIRNPCGAGRAHFNINADGTISPCPEVSHIRAKNINEIYEKFKGIYSHFNEIYNNPYINVGAFCPGKNYYVNKDIRKVPEKLIKFYDLIYRG